MEQSVPKRELKARNSLIHWVKAMDKTKLALSFALLIVILLTVPAVVYYEADNSNLRTQLRGLQEEISVLKTANLTAALGVTEIKYLQVTGNENGHVWITGWVFNSGGSMAKNAGLNVLAFDKSRNLLMNATVPIVSYEFSIASNEQLASQLHYWVGGFILPGELKYGNVLSQENVTVGFNIFHEGSFPNSTIYEINPVWENPQ